MSSLVRTRWAAIGAAISVALGGGSLGIVHAVQSSGERATYTPISPCRLIDTRPAADVPGLHSPIGPGQTHTQDAHGDNGQCTAIPTDATALTINATALDATSQTYLTFWPADQPQPIASQLNPAVGQGPTPNAVNVKLSPTGQFKIFNERGNTGIIVDITGYYTDHNHDDRYYTKTEFDTRTKSISIDPLGVHVRNGAVMATGIATNSGLLLPNAALDSSDPNPRLWPSFEFGLTLPPDFTPNTDVTFELLWHTNSGSCGVDLRTNFSSISREGRVPVQVLSFGNRAPDGTPTSSAANQSAKTTFTLKPDSFGLLPGDAVIVGFFRSAGSGADTCTGGQQITGISVTYQ